MTGGWIKLHSEELHYVYCIHVALTGEKRNAYMLIVGKEERMRPLGRPRRIWVDNVNMDLGEAIWSGMDLIGLAEDRNKWRGIVKAIMNFHIL
jgi:hypothetical protein